MRIVVFSVFLSLIFFFGCSNENPVSTESKTNKPILVNTFLGHIRQLTLNKFSPHKIAVLVEGHVLYSLNGGISFDTLGKDKWMPGLTGIKFDNKIENILYVGTADATVLVFLDFGQKIAEILPGEIGSVELIHPTLNDTLVLIAKKTWVSLSAPALYWLNRNKLSWCRILSFEDTLEGKFGRYARGIMDISDAMKDEKHIIAVSDRAVFGIFVTDSKFEKYNIYHYANEFYFVKHALNEDGSTGIALIYSWGRDSALYKSQNLFETVHKIEDANLNGLIIKDFFFIDKNTLVLYAKNNQGKSFILSSRNDFSKFNINLEVDGDITALDYDPINKLIYFINYTEKGSELYKYPFR